MTRLVDAVLAGLNDEWMAGAPPAPSRAASEPPRLPSKPTVVSDECASGAGPMRQEPRVTGSSARRQPIPTCRRVWIDEMAACGVQRGASEVRHAQQQLPRQTTMLSGPSRLHTQQTSARPSSPRTLSRSSASTSTM